MGTTKNLINQNAIEKIKELADKAMICHFATALGNRPISSRPMSTQQVDDSGAIWFFSGKSSTKNSEIKLNPEVQLFYAHQSTSEYLTVFGTAEVTYDKSKIEELWTPLAKTWFNEGKDDPEITLIKVEPIEAHYWDTKHNKTIQLIKMVAGSIMGKQLDDGVEGRMVL